LAGDDDYLRGATSINHQVALRANFKMYSRSAKGGEKGDPNRNPWLAKMAKWVPNRYCLGLKCSPRVGSSPGRVKPKTV
jgi:hypothetical protein